MYTLLKETMALAIIGAGLLVFGVLLTLPYIGSLSGAAYGYAPVTHMGGLGILLIILGLISAILSITVRNDTSHIQVIEETNTQRSAGPLQNFTFNVERSQDGVVTQ